MLWVKTFHIFFVICWFAGIFYLPRLFVYHASAEDQASKERFKIMERKLYYGIMTPCGVLTTLFGIWLLMLLPGYMQQLWLHIKLSLVLLLWIFHIYCGMLLKDFKHDNNRHGHKFYRVINELPVFILVAILILTVVKPF